MSKKGNLEDAAMGWKRGLSFCAQRKKHEGEEGRLVQSGDGRIQRSKKSATKGQTLSTSGGGTVLQIS